jgi:large-conductance mechanosensitive channel
MGVGRIGRNIKSFVSGKDLVIFAISIALSNQFQVTIKNIIDNMIMPFVSRVTGATNLSSRQVVLQKAKDKNPGIQLKWGAALESAIVFLISLVIMVEIARYITVHFVKSSTVTFE